MSGSGAAPLGVEQEDVWMWETPADLVCPITLQLFKDPVINAVGQVYERAAIERHLALRGTDPITNAPLASAQLIPVYTLKSRSYEFREHVAKACVDKAYSTRHCELSVRYLRRAAELVQGLPPHQLKVPGLCQDVVEFLQAHPSNAYNSTALRIFADGLRQAGYVDQAMQVYLRLVEYGEDHAQQAAALRQCLACVGGGGGLAGAHHGSSTSPTDPYYQQQQQGQDQHHLAPAEHASSGQGVGGDDGGGGGMDQAMLPFLAHFMESQQTFSAGQMLDLLQEAKVPEQLIIQLCEHLLSRRAKLACGSAPPAHLTTSSSMGRGTHGQQQQQQQQQQHGALLPSTSSGAAVNGMGYGGGTGSLQGGIEHHDLLLRYTQLRLRVVQRQLDAMEAATTSGGRRDDKRAADQHTAASKGGKGGKPIAALKQKQQGGKSTDGAGFDTHEDGKAGVVECREGGEAGPPLYARVGRFLMRKRRGLASGAVVALALLDPKHVVVRLLQAGGVVALAVCAHRGGGETEGARCEGAEE